MLLVLRILYHFAILMSIYVQHLLLVLLNDFFICFQPVSLLTSTTYYCIIGTRVPELLFLV